MRRDLGIIFLERINLILVRGCLFLASRVKLDQAEQGVFPAYVIKFEGGGEHCSWEELRG